MIITTLELPDIFRLQAQSKTPLTIEGKVFSFFPFALGRPHEVTDLRESIREVTLRQNIVTLTGKPLGTLLDDRNGLLGLTIETRIYTIDRMTDEVGNPEAIYREQILRSRSNGTDVVLQLSTESQPLTHWTGFII